MKTIQLHPFMCLDYYDFPPLTLGYRYHDFRITYDSLSHKFTYYHMLTQWKLFHLIYNVSLCPDSSFVYLEILHALVLYRKSTSLHVDDY